MSDISLEELEALARAVDAARAQFAWAFNRLALAILTLEDKEVRDGTKLDKD